MFCSQCGKKVLETMLFCPFCGSPIVVPEQESSPETVPPEAPPAPGPEESAPAEEAFVPLDLSGGWFDDSMEIPKPETEPEFEPLDLSEWNEEPPKRAEKPKPVEVSELLSSQLREEPVKLGGHVPDLTDVHPPKPDKTGSRKPATYVPVREFNPDDIFLDGSGRKSYDEDEDEDDGYDYEEPEEGGFWIRHIRGVVALSLMIVVLAIVAGWGFSSAGQTALARANLAWKADTYAQLAYDAYESQNYLLSANYYERALARDADSYVYANSAGVAYYLAGDTARAADMARRAIGIDPSRADAYQLLLRLYPDAATRPWEISSLLQQGYQLTGDEALKAE